MKDGFDFDGFLSEAKKYIENEEPIQASEKLYKCAEETIKFLAQKFELKEYYETKENNKWNARLLFDAVYKLSDKISEDVRRYWETAWFLHCEGFHERRLDVKNVHRRMKDIENLIEIAKDKE